jgi:Flp pilus assembly pilin Flp
MVRGAFRRGATKVEYALMVMLLGVCCLLVLAALGTGVGGLFSGVGGTFRDVNGDHPSAATAEPDDGKGKGRRGNPGQGNAGNDKAAGNYPGAK